MSDHRACAECGKPERRWRRMMAKPLGGSVWAFVCSESCWDALDVRRRAGEGDNA